ncbi:hypothetical protein [Bradyrhizobium sp. Ash2021]|uniref:hypothetical protein n=1 Tax=Bradyrhizobium sp. Ash2021 TaxID=2954771 RepID=UPI002814B0CC|nr:hypothetical protein [Bradyrhizobium sp. Ash2021]WMT70935.1 hypothetical protein NL528_22715 [Bradyrhizobium sp. Ash2021]
MDFSRMSDAIRLYHHPHHHDGYDGHDGFPISRASWLSMFDTGDDGAVTGGRGSFVGADAHFHDALSRTHEAGPAEHHRGGDTDQSVPVQADQHAAPTAVPGGGGGNDNAAGTNVSAIEPGSGSSNLSIGASAVDSGANTAGNGGDGYFYGGIIHASMLIYEPINITVAVGYGSVAWADQTNNVNVDQSAFQMAGVGGDGGSDNIASGGSVGGASFGSGVIATGGNNAGNGGDGYFSGALVDAPVVIYHPINIAVAGPGGTAHASQSNTVEIDQSAVQIAGVGGNGGNDNAATGGSVITPDPVWGSKSGGSAWDVVHTGGSQAGNGGDGYFYGGLVHTAVVLYDPINIAVAGYNSSTYAVQTNSVYLDQSSVQMAGIGGNGGNGNVAMGGGGSLVSHGLWGGSDAIATGANGAGNGGGGHFSGSLIDVSIAIYAPINIAIAGPHSTAEADQINSVYIDQSAVQIAAVGGDGGHGNLALGGGLATHLLSDLHLMG